VPERRDDNLLVVQPKVGDGSACKIERVVATATLLSCLRQKRFLQMTCLTVPALQDNDLWPKETNVLKHEPNALTDHRLVSERHVALDVSHATDSIRLRESSKSAI